MKKLLAKVLVAGVVLLGGLGLNQVNNVKQVEAGTTHVQNKVVKTKKSHGFIVLDQKEKSNRTTVVAQITKVNSKWAFVTNVFDKKDTIVLDKKDIKGMKKGGVVLVTFNNDDIENVKANKLNVDNKVIGQVVKYSKKKQYVEVNGKMLEIEYLKK